MADCAEITAEHEVSIGLTSLRPKHGCSTWYIVDVVRLRRPRRGRLRGDPVDLQLFQLPQVRLTTRYRASLLLAASAAVPVARCETYDYIVVGSGPGGAPLASNLARAGYSTLLIEAGGDESTNPTYSNLGNFLEAANDEASRWDFWVKHYDDPAQDLKFKHTTWDTGNGTFYVGLSPPPGAKVPQNSENDQS